MILKLSYDIFLREQQNNKKRHYFHLEISKESVSKKLCDHQSRSEGCGGNAAPKKRADRLGLEHKRVVSATT